MNKPYVGDSGTLIQLDTGVPLIGATLAQILAKRPDGVILTWMASVSGSMLQYTTIATDLSMPGTWILQAKVTLPDGSWLGEATSVKIYGAFQ